MIAAINDLGRHLAPLLAELEAALGRVLRSGHFILGPEVQSFEATFAEYCGVAHCVTVANGTDALELALRSLGLGPDARVATVANAGMYGTLAILAAGARPVFIDVEPDSLLIDLGALEREAARRPFDAVLATHLYGQMVDMPRLARICTTAGMALIEDCAQAHGASIGGTKAGAWSDAGCFSFYPTKNLGALGDGGAVVTRRSDVEQNLRRLRQYGWTAKYASSREGGRNSRLDEIQAAALRVLLPHLDAWNARRRAIAQAYTASIHHPRVRRPTPGAVADDRYVAHLYVVRTADRAGLQAHMARAGCPSAIHFPIADHHQESLRAHGLAADLPETERACAEVLTLPCFPEMTEAEVRQVITSVNDW